MSSSETERYIVANVRDVLIQEIMTLNNSEFEGEAIDMDSIAFAGKHTVYALSIWTTIDIYN